MKLIRLQFESAKAFLGHYSDSSPGGILFCRTKTRLEANDPVIGEVSFPELPNPTLLRAIVIHSEPTKGVWLKLARGDSPNRDYLLGIARGEIVVNDAEDRNHNRFPADLPVEYHFEADGHVHTHVGRRTEDLAPGGVFIKGEEPPPVGTPVTVEIGPDPSGDTYQLRGEVAWIRGGYDDTGFGVRFTATSEDGRKLRSRLRRARETGRYDLLPN